MNIPIFMGIMKIIEMWILMASKVLNNLNPFVLIVYIISVFSFLLTCSVLDIKLRKLKRS